MITLFVQLLKYYICIYNISIFSGYRCFAILHRSIKNVAHTFNQKTSFLISFRVIKKKKHNYKLYTTFLNVEGNM